MTSKIRIAVRCVAGVLAYLASSIATASVVTVQNYEYPISDRFVATVVGTPVEYEAKLPSIPFEQRSIDIFPDRKTPDVFFYGKELLYSVALQDHESPLIFLIAGTGASHEGSKNRNMAKAFYQAGFHVVSTSSPTFNNFVTAASYTGVVGDAKKDAEDIYRVFEKIWAELEQDIDVSTFNVTGYSLGGFNAAYVAKLDETRQSFNFENVLLINPPVSIYNSISLLDRMINNIPGGMDNFDKFFDNLMRAYINVYKESSDAIGDDFLYKAYKALNLKDEQLAALIGVSFRLSSASLIFTSDVVVDFGFIKPKGLILNRYSNLTQYNEVANRIGFTDYYHEFFYPFYKQTEPDATRDEFIAAISLEEIEDYLRDTEKITVMHNADDIILQPGEIEFFADVFGTRATIYPTGGHCGNMSYSDNVAHMVAVFTGGGAP
ncbi:MAG: alpha/beta hydrolase [Halieaceae bacterium]|nr:alpha/beta hydrolase [Halieaceae bacterium]